MPADDSPREVETIDEDDPANNMYGCSPCPKCQSRCRWPDQQNVLRCDDCGYLATWKMKERKP